MDHQNRLIQYILARDNKLEITDSQNKKILLKYPDIFKILQDGRKQYARVDINLELCGAHYSKAGCQGQCGQLHMCKFFLMSGNCKFVAGSCKFGHVLESPHNASILMSKHMQGCSLDQVRLLLTSSTTPTTAMPKICKFYNVEAGCGKGSKCHALHVCKHYLQDECNFGKACKRSHDVFDAQPKALLVRHGLDVARSPKLVLQELRAAYCAGDGQTTPTPNPQKAAPPIVPRGSASATSGARPKTANSPGINVTATKMAAASLDDSHDEGDIVVCPFHLRGKCNYGQSCRNLHASRPYQWQFKHGGKWIDFNEASNNDTELEFSQPDKDTCHALLDIPTKDGKTKAAVCKVNFQDMMMEKRKTQHVKKYAVRRVGTMSSVEASPWHYFITVWHWYWEEDSSTETWKMFSKQLENQVETSYLEDSTVQIRFRTGAHEYILSYNDMVQQNVTYGTKRRVRRRPEFVSKQQVLQEISDASAGKKQGLRMPKSGAASGDEQEFPDHWDLNYTSSSMHYQLVPVTATGDTKAEYDGVVKTLNATLAKRVTRVVRIQNAELWEAFARKKKWMQKKLSNVNEKHLFHGTSRQYFDAICEQGFDWRVSGSSTGTLYGKGCYFARDAKYSSSYTDCNKLFLVRVLVGEYTKGNPNMVRGPPKNPAQPLGALYDSVVDTVTNPSIYVLFKDDQSYPEYIVEYQ